MGTRGLLGHIIAGRRRSVYNHWNSFPSALGLGLVRFILQLTPITRQLMAARVSQLTWVDVRSEPSPELQRIYSEAGFADLSVNRQRTSDWYCLLRKMQGEAALPKILSGSLKHAADETEFAKDGSFCEWAYFVDWDAAFVEIWKGNQYGVEEGDPFEVEAKGGHRSITMIDKLKFEDLTERYMDELEERLMKSEEDGKNDHKAE